jgi:hypothetical protein
LINQSFSIMDKRKTNGGKREGAGRKPKAEEQKLIETLSPMMPQAHEALKISLAKGERWAVELAYKYFYGMPKQQTELDIKTDNINILPIDWTE